MRSAFLLALLPIAACVQMAQITESKPVQLSAAQMAQIEQTITYTLIDPNSAMFRNVRVRDVTLETGETVRRVCGEVNAKNRMGGYVGFEMFGGVMKGGTFVREDFFGACEPW